MKLCSVTLTGTKQSQIGKVDPASLQPGKRLEIYRRADNAYDPQAMSVHLMGLTSPMVGWIQNKEPEDKRRKEVLCNLAVMCQLHAVVEQFEPATKFLRVEVHLTEVIVSEPPCFDAEEFEGKGGIADPDE